VIPIRWSFDKRELDSWAGLIYVIAMLLNPRLSAIWERRSIRAYTGTPIPDEVIADLLRAAMAAPSAAAKDPWRFVVVQDRAMLRRMAEALPHGRMLAEAGAGIVVCGDLSVAHDGQLSYLLQDCAAAIENLLIVAHVLGLGACWLGVHPREARIDVLRSLLRIAPPVLPVSVVAAGYPAEQKEPRTRYDSRYVHHEQW
jgi:nitroreductase